MTTSIQQAETALHNAAVAFAETDEGYHATWKRSGQEFGKPLNEETNAACKKLLDAGLVLEDAARGLARAIAAEHGTRVMP